MISCKKKLSKVKIVPKRKTGFTNSTFEKPDDCKITISLSVCILEYTKNIERPVIIGNRVGMICGRELKINLKKTEAGKPLLTINSISWTLFPRQKTEVISTSIRRELFKSCLKIYLSTKFIVF